jgi:hypothetical protein
MKFHAIENAKNYLFTGRYSKHGDFNFPEICFTEFRLDFKMIGGPKAIFFTRWKDLEEGSSMSDSKCQRHLLSRNTPHPRRK